MPVEHRPQAAGGRQRDHVPRHRARREASGGQDLAGRRRPATVDDEKLITQRGPYIPLRDARARGALPGAPGLQGLRRRSATTATSPTRCSFDQLDRHGGLLAGDSLPAAERAHVEVEYHYSTGRRSLSHNRGGLLRPVRADQAQPQGLRGQSSATTTLARLRPAAAARAATSEVAVLRQASTRCPAYQNVATDVDRLVDRRGRPATTRTCASRSARRRREGSRWYVGGRAGTTPTGTTIPQLHGTLDVGVALPLAHSSVWLRNAPAASRTATAHRAVRELLSSARSATTTSTAATIKRYRECYAFPGFDIDEISGAVFVASHGRGEPAAAAVRSRVGTPGFYLDWMRPAVFVGLVTNLERQPIPHPVRRTSAAQVDMRFSVLHWFDDDAVGRRRRGASRTASAPATSGWSRSRSCRLSVACSRILVALLPGRRVPVGAGPARQLQAGGSRCRGAGGGLRRRRGGRRLRRQRPRCSTSRGSASAALHALRRARDRGVPQGGRDLALDPHASHRLPRGRGDLRLRGRRRLRAGREPRLPRAIPRRRRWARGSCAASAPRSCTAAPRRSSRWWDSR